jgi:glycosyltransferase involved in cell wall biosynthesis
MDNISVLHIDTESYWRGGQQQAIYLYQGLLAKNIKTNFICTPNSQLEQYLKAKMLNYLTLPLRNELDFPSAFRIARFAKNNAYSILHLHTAHAVMLGIWAKLIYPKLKLVVARRVDFSIHKNILSKFKYSNSYIDRIVAISNNIKNVLINDGIEPTKISTIRSGVDIHKFDSITPEDDYKERILKIPNDAFIVGTVAALTGHKDYPTLLKTAKIVLDKSKNIHFIAAGDGKDKEKIHGFAKELNILNRFHFLGQRDDVGKLLKSMDIFVLASKKEGLGTSVLDAMTVGLPIIGTKAGGIPEMISHGHNGLLVEKQNPSEFALAISKLIEDETLRTKLSENALKTVRQFSVNETVKQNVQLYYELN